MWHAGSITLPRKDQANLFQLPTNLKGIDVLKAAKSVTKHYSTDSTIRLHADTTLYEIKMTLHLLLELACRYQQVLASILVTLRLN